MRAIPDRDEAVFRERLAKLQPGKSGRFSAVINLCKLVDAIRSGEHPAYGPRLFEGRSLKGLGSALPR